MTGDLFISEYLQNQIFIAFDTETTGMWAPSHKLVELSAVKFSLKKGIIDKFDYLINPERKIPSEVIEIHGITDEMVQDAPIVNLVLEKFVEFCGNDSILIAHNAPFDISFVGLELKRCALEFNNNPILDTVDIFKRYFPDVPSYSLLNLCRYFKITERQDHRALSDALFVYQLFKIAVTKFPDVANFSQLKKLVNVYQMSDAISETSTLPPKYSEINTAIEKKLPLEIDYEHPRKGLDTRVIYPREIHRLGSIYYLIGFCERAGEDRTFRLDRIADYRITE